VGYLYGPVGIPLPIFGLTGDDSVQEWTSVSNWQLLPVSEQEVSSNLGMAGTRHGAMLIHTVLLARFLG